MRCILFVILTLLAVARHVHAQDDTPRKKPFPGGKCYMMRVTMRDKGQNEYRLQEPERYLSAKAIERRRRQKIDVDSTDLPVSPAYIEGLRSCGMQIVTTSRWNNTVVVKARNMAAFKAVRRLPYVAETRLVWIAPDSIRAGRERVSPRRELRVWGTESVTEYGVTYDQTHMLRGESLHQRGYRGKGMTIGVLDGGFMNVDRIPAFKNVRIAGTADLLEPGTDEMFRSIEHGTKVLSLMALTVSGQYVGTAPEADYWLIRCEDSETEQLVEEDYWAAAAELADSAGVDVISSSLGYAEFDHKEMTHKYRELDGKTAVCSRAASMLAQKGIVLVCSAGNDGMGAWKKINVPADAHDVLTVGAVTPQMTNAAFSSIGPTADGRIKPDVMASGSPAAIVSGRGAIQNDMGTSFAAPQIAGLVACLWQSMPDKTARQIIEIVRHMGNNKDAPDNIYGYGIPDFSKK